MIKPYSDEMKAWWNGKEGKGRPKGLLFETLVKVVSLVPEKGESPDEELGLSFKDILEKGRKQYGFTHTTLLRYLKHLVDIGFVSETHRGKKVFYRRLFPDLSSFEFGEYLTFRIGWALLPLFPEGPVTGLTASILRLHLLEFSRTIGAILRDAQKVPKEKRGDFIKTTIILYLTPILEALELWGRYDLPEKILKEAEEPLKRIAYETTGFWYREEGEELYKIREEELHLELTLINRFLEAKYGKEVLYASSEERANLAGRHTLEEFREFWKRHPGELRKIRQKEEEITKRRRELVRGFIQREYPGEWREIYGKWLKLDKKCGKPTDIILEKEEENEAHP